MGQLNFAPVSWRSFGRTRFRPHSTMAQHELLNVKCSTRISLIQHGLPLLNVVCSAHCSAARKLDLFECSHLFSFAYYFHFTLFPFVYLALFDSHCRFCVSAYFPLVGRGKWNYESCIGDLFSRFNSDAFVSRENFSIFISFRIFSLVFAISRPFVAFESSETLTSCLRWPNL